MSVSILLTGRLVSGHPMVEYPVTDNITHQPKLRADGTPRKSVNIGFAIPKGAETDWKQTAWGAQMLQVAQADWPNGEFNAPAFSWKVIDGDSQVPNKKGNKPCDREGYPGNWVVFASSELGPVRCFHNGKFQPHECIQDKNEIKCGDYGRLNVQVRGNNPSQTPGIYVNPDLFSLDRAGEPIITSTQSDANAVFGGPTATATQQMAAGAGVPPTAPAPTAPAPTAPAPAPAPEFLQPQRTMSAKAIGMGYTYEALKTAGFTDEQMIADGYLNA